MPWELNGNSGTNNGSFLGTLDQQPLAIRTNASVNSSDKVVVDVNGNVGIGTSSPTSKLEVHAQDGLQIVGFQPFQTLQDSSNGKRARIQHANGEIAFFTDTGLASGSPAMLIQDGTNNGNSVQIRGQDALQIVGFQPFLTLSDSNSGFRRVRIQDANGSVAIFTESGFSSGIPAVVIQDGTNTVQIKAQEGIQIVGFQPFFTLSDSNSGFKRGCIQTANGDLVLYTDSGLASQSPAMVIKDGTGVNMKGHLAIAGSVSVVGADCAEHFDVAPDTECEAGTVVVINNEGYLEPSSIAYDKRVAGVVSGAGNFQPGIVLDQHRSEDGQLPIALVGKVYCKVDAQSAAIEVGDLLTTSESPGCAMKASEASRAFGAVIGKALRPLSHGIGLIPILVALQ